MTYEFAGKANGQKGAFGGTAKIQYENANASKVAETAFREVAARLELVKMHLENPKPAVNSIVAEFSLMEAERFLNQGISPMFGGKVWIPTDKKTLAERKSKGGNPGDETLLNFGYLARAASNPELDYVGNKAVKIIIDPLREEGPNKYNRGKNYGMFAQLGMGNNPRRPFVEMTPRFVKIANEILRFYVLYGTEAEIKREKLKVPSNTWKNNDVKQGLRKFESRISRRKEGMETFGASRVNLSGEKTRYVTVGDKILGKRGY
jgi:hypothetical protein